MGCEIPRSVCSVDLLTLLRSGFRKRDAPYLGELAATASSVHVTPDGLIWALSPNIGGDLQLLRREYEGYRAALLEGIRQSTLHMLPLSLSEMASMKYMLGTKGWIGQKLKPMLSCRAIASHRSGGILLIDDPLARMNKMSLRLRDRKSVV